MGIGLIMATFAEDNIAQGTISIVSDVPDRSIKAEEEEWMPLIRMESRSRILLFKDNGMGKFVPAERQTEI